MKIPLYVFQNFTERKICMHLRLLILIMLVCLPMSSWSATIHYALDVRIDIKNKKITGTALLKAETNKQIWLSVRNLQELNVDGNPIISTADDSIRLTVEKGQVKSISYEAQLTSKGGNFIDQNNVFLTKDWYPQPDVLVNYALSVTLPKYFIATSEAEAVTIQEKGETKTFSFQFKHLLDTLSLAASTRFVLRKDFYNHITIEAYFFKEDAHLADTYIAHTKEYLAMYEAMLTSYPYRRFCHC